MSGLGRIVIRANIMEQRADPFSEERKARLDKLIKRNEAQRAAYIAEHGDPRERLDELVRSVFGTAIFEAPLRIGPQGQYYRDWEYLDEVTEQDSEAPH
jgi:hypothetical protein